MKGAFLPVLSLLKSALYLNIPVYLSSSESNEDSQWSELDFGMFLIFTSPNAD